MQFDGTKPVLVVDPSGDAFPVVSRLMSRAGASTVERAESGEAALAYLAEKTPALVISEWQMTPMSGAEFLRQMRAGEKTATIPLLFASDTFTARDALDALELGADAVAVIPLLPRDFLKKIAAIPERPSVSP